MYQVCAAEGKQRMEQPRLNGEKVSRPVAQNRIYEAAFCLASSMIASQSARCSRNSEQICSCMIS